MVRTLFKLFVVSFYKANTGFFLFFFFIFFGSVNGSSLISYHASLLRSIIGSWVILCGVFFFWILYQIKCFLFVLRIINSAEGTFLYNIQALSPKSQSAFYLLLQTALYAPVVAYSAVAVGFGIKHGHEAAALAILLFQLLLTICGTSAIYNRMNGWLKRPVSFDFGIRLPKPFSLFLIYHLLTERKIALVALKLLSVILLYIVLVLNKGKSDNDSFLLFYIVILLAHFIIPFFAVEFLEKDLGFFRNLPLRKWNYAVAYLLCYVLLLLPELIYLFLYGRSLLPPSHIIAYYGVAIASLFFLTGVQYSEAMNRDEFMKVGFALFFVSIFALHVEAFLTWMLIQFVIGGILFWSGTYFASSFESE